MKIQYNFGKIMLFLLGLSFFIQCGPDDQDDTPLLENTVEVTEKIKGGSVLSTFELKSETTARLFDMPEKTNAEWVSLSPIIHVDISENRITIPTNIVKNIPQIVDNVKDQGASNYMVKPLISFERNFGVDFWGDYEAPSEEKWVELEEAFRELLFAYAEVSLTIPNVRILCIGNELFQFSKQRPDFFRNTAVALKQQYPSLKLTYAANWDEFEHIEFWDVLDYIGINPYFPLVNKSAPTVAEIENAYQPIRTILSNLSATYNKPILFTEYGFRSIDYATWRAWELPDAVSGGGDYNPTVQTNGYQAFFNTFWDEKWIAGGFFWEWRIRSSFDVEQNFKYLDTDWQMNCKPAVEIIKSVYTENGN